MNYYSPTHRKCDIDYPKNTDILVNIGSYSTATIIDHLTSEQLNSTEFVLLIFRLRLYGLLNEYDYDPANMDELNTMLESVNAPFSMSATSKDVLYNNSDNKKAFTLVTFVFADQHGETNTFSLVKDFVYSDYIKYCIDYDSFIRGHTFLTNLITNSDIVADDIGDTILGEEYNCIPMLSIAKLLDPDKRVAIGIRMPNVFLEEDTDITWKHLVQFDIVNDYKSPNNIKTIGNVSKNLYQFNTSKPNYKYITFNINVTEFCINSYSTYNVANIYNEGIGIHNIIKEHGDIDIQIKAGYPYNGEEMNFATDLPFFDNYYTQHSVVHNDAFALMITESKKMEIHGVVSNNVFDKVEIAGNESDFTMNYTAQQYVTNLGTIDGSYIKVNNESITAVLITGIQINLCLKQDVATMEFPIKYITENLDGSGKRIYTIKQPDITVNNTSALVKIYVFNDELLQATRWYIRYEYSPDVTFIYTFNVIEMGIEFNNLEEQKYVYSLGTFSHINYKGYSFDTNQPLPLEFDTANEIDLDVTTSSPHGLVNKDPIAAWGLDYPQYIVYGNFKYVGSAAILDSFYTTNLYVGDPNAIIKPQTYEETS